jgi:hypothetical protein
VFFSKLNFEQLILKEEDMSQVMGFIQIVVYILVGLSKFAGTLLIGLGIGWFAVDILRQNQHPWQFQIAFFLGIIALLIAFLLYSHLGLGGFCIGMGVAIIKWGFPKAEKDKKD